MKIKRALSVIALVAVMLSIGANLKHGPTFPPDPWDGKVSHGPTFPPDPWDGKAI